MPEDGSISSAIDRIKNGDEPTSTVADGSPERLVASSPSHSVVPAIGTPPVALRSPDTQAGDPIVEPYSDAVPTDSPTRLQLRGEIARGGMGAVLLGRDTNLGRDVAVKILLETHQHRTELVQRFVEEAQIAGQLQHPGVVPVYEIGQFADQRPYFTMKLVKGQTLSKLLAERSDLTADRPRYLGIFLQVCQALAYAHASGVIHRDLKPANVMVGAFGEVQVMDWGLAKVLKEAGVAEGKTPEIREADVIRTARSGSDGPGKTGSQTRDGQVMGTPAYMAPEQARGEVAKLDVRCDVFGLGAILCQVLTGLPPYTGDNARTILERAIRADLADAWTRLSNCGADPELIALAKRCLSVEPADRPRDAGVVAEEITTYLDSVEARLRRAEMERVAAEARAVEERRRRRVQLLLVASVLLLLSGAGGGGWWVWQQQVKHDADLREQRLEREAEQTRQQAEQASQEAELRQAVEPDLRLVMEELHKPKLRLIDVPRAETVLAGAEGRVAQCNDAELLQRVRQARAELEEIHANQLLVARLDQARLQRGAAGPEGLDRQGSSQLFEEAFRSIGLNLRAGPVEEVADRIAGSPLRQELLLALDQWSLSVPLGEGFLLRAVANRADPDPWRRRLRDGLYNERAVNQLANEARPGELSVASLVFLAEALQQKDRPSKRALVLLSEARKRAPQDFWVNLELGNALRTTSPPQYEEAVRYYTAAQALRPDSVVVLNNLAVALHELNRMPEAEAACREAILLNSNVAATHHNLGNALAGQNKFRLAETAYNEAIRLRPNFPEAYYGLGNTFLSRNNTARAETAYKEAIHLRPDFYQAYHNLAQALFRQGKHKDAEAAYRETIRLKPDLAEAHYNLGLALRSDGRYAESLESLRRGDELGKKQPDWPYPSARAVREVEELVKKGDARVQAILKGTAKPTDADEALRLAGQCGFQKRHAAEARLYTIALTLRPALADDLEKSTCFDAACAAALAGCGRGTDTETLDDKSRAELRGQCQKWLRSLLTAYNKRMRDGPSEQGDAVQRTLVHWQKEGKLAGVRNAEALAQLPEAERAGWEKFWQEVEALRQRAAGAK